MQDLTVEYLYNNLKHMVENGYGDFIVKANDATLKEYLIGARPQDKEFVFNVDLFNNEVMQSVYKLRDDIEERIEKFHLEGVKK